MDEFASQNVSKCSSLRERGTLRTASNVRSAHMELIQPHSKSCSVPSSEQAPMGWTIERFFFFHAEFILSEVSEIKMAAKNSMGLKFKV